MLKKLRRYSSRSVPVKKFVRIHVMGVTFDTSILATRAPGEQFRITFARSKKNVSSACKKLESSGGKLEFDETLQLGVTFYSDLKGKILEKKGTLLMQILTSSSPVPVSFASTSLELNAYFAASVPLQLNLPLISNGKFSGATLQCELCVEDNLSTIDDNFSDASDNVSVKSDTENRLVNFPTSLPGGITQSSSVEFLGSLDTPLSPIEEGERGQSAMLSYEDLGWHNNPLKSDYEFQKCEEIAALTSQIQHVKAEAAMRAEEVEEMKEKLKQVTALLELQPIVNSNGTITRGFGGTGGFASADWIPDARTPVKTENADFISPQVPVPWASNPMGPSAIFKEQKRRASLKMAEYATASNVTVPGANDLDESTDYDGAGNSSAIEIACSRCPAADLQIEALQAAISKLEDDLLQSKQREQDSVRSLKSEVAILAAQLCDAQQIIENRDTSIVALTEEKSAISIQLLQAQSDLQCELQEATALRAQVDELIAKAASKSESSRDDCSRVVIPCKDLVQSHKLAPDLIVLPIDQSIVSAPVVIPTTNFDVNGRADVFTDKMLRQDVICMEGSFFPNDTTIIAEDHLEEVHSLKQQLADAHAVVTGYADSIVTLETEVQALRVKLADSQALITTSERVIAELNTKVNSYGNKNLDYEEEIRSLIMDEAERASEMTALANSNAELESNAKLLTDMNAMKTTEIESLRCQVASLEAKLLAVSNEARLEEMQNAKLLIEMSRISAHINEDLLSATTEAARCNSTEPVSRDGDSSPSPISRVLSASSLSHGDLSTQLTAAQIELQCKREEFQRLQLEFSSGQEECTTLRNQLLSIDKLFLRATGDDDLVIELKHAIIKMSESMKCSKSQCALTLLITKQHQIGELESQNTILRSALDGIRTPQRKKSDNYSSFSGPHTESSSQGHLPGSTNNGDIAGSNDRDTNSSMPNAISVSPVSARRPSEGHSPVVWASNLEHPNCMSQSCRKPFNRISRWRHHCRLCGGLFCDSCSSRRVRAPFALNPNTLVRACESCSGAPSDTQG